MCTICGMPGMRFGANGTTSSPMTGSDIPGYGGSGSNTQISMGAVTDVNINGVLSGVRWTTGTLTYSFPTLPSQYEAGYSETANNFSAATEALKTATRYAMNLLSEYTNMVTTEVAPTTNADIRSAFSDSANPTAYAYYPSNGTKGGDVWYGSNYPEYANPIKGQYAWTTVLHEIGHALGLKHGHETGGPSNTAVSAPYDQMAYTLMTYRSYQGGPLTGYSNELNGYAQTFMMYDIAALQAMYGANYNTNSGNTTYSWSATTGEMSINGVGQGAPGGNRIFMTLWDGGGTDTYDFSSYTSNLNVNLAPGSFSITSATQRANLGSGNIAPGNIFNALMFNNDTRSLIENVFGGSGNDNISGNQANNSLSGGGGNDEFIDGEGNDSVNGGVGNDRMFAGAGADSYDGGADTDTLSYVLSTAGVVISLSGGTGSGGFAAGDTIVPASIENLNGSAFGDSLSGSDSNNRIEGGDGADEILDYDGSDVVFGDGGNDRFFAGAGADVYNGGSGIDTLSYALSTAGVNVSLASGQGFGGFAEGDGISGGTVENLTGSAFNDLLGGDGVANHIIGGDGNDEFLAYGGDDILEGGSGADRFFGEDGADRIYGDGGFDTVSYAARGAISANLQTGFVTDGSTGTDILIGIESIIGSNTGSDSITGDVNNNYLSGGGGSDDLFGYLGNDTLEGGSGNDLFIFTNVGGEDLIVDFTAGASSGDDRIYLGGFGISDLAGVISRSTNVAGGVRVQLDADDVLFVMGAGVSTSTLHSSDFLFA